MRHNLNHYRALVGDGVEDDGHGESVVLRHANFEVADMLDKQG